MDKLVFDSGVKEYQINDGGVLRFNPSDPNVYARFLEVGEKLEAVEQSLTEQAKEFETDDGSAVVEILSKADKGMKEVLGWVFGPSNDFDKILGGVNLLAVAANGERVVTNLLRALEPVLLEGAERYADEKVNEAVTQAEIRRSHLE